MNARNFDARDLRSDNGGPNGAQGSSSPSVGDVSDHDDLSARIDRLYDRYVVGPKRDWQARPGNSRAEGGPEGLRESSGDSGGHGGVPGNGQARPLEEGKRDGKNGRGSQGGMQEDLCGSGGLQASQRNERAGRRDDGSKDGGNGRYPGACTKADGGDALEDERDGMRAETLSFLEIACPSAVRSSRIRSGTIRRMTEATKTLKGLLPLLDKIETAG